MSNHYDNTCDLDKQLFTFSFARGVGVNKLDIVFNNKFITNINNYLDEYKKTTITELIIEK